MVELIEQCTRYIENNENDELKQELQKSIGKCYLNIEKNNNLKKELFFSQINLYDVAIKNKNFTAVNILSELDDKCKWFTRNSKTFTRTTSKLKYLLLNEKFNISQKFINKIIINDNEEGEEENGNGADILKLIFQYINFNNELIIQFLINYYKNKSSLSQSQLKDIIDKENDKLNTLLNHQISRNYYSDYGIPLFIACRHKNYPIIECLIKYGADVNLDIEEKEEGKIINPLSPLSIAFDEKNEKLMKILIEHGANVNAQWEYQEYIFEEGYGCPDCGDNRCVYNCGYFEMISSYVYTPLITACIHGNDSLVNYLIEHGADVNLQCNIAYDDDKIINALGVACVFENLTIIKMLIEYGANIHAEFKYQDNTTTPLDIILTNGNKSIIKYLVEQGIIEMKNYNVTTNNKRQKIISPQQLSPDIKSPQLSLIEFRPIPPPLLFRPPIIPQQSSPTQLRPPILPPPLFRPIPLRPPIIPPPQFRPTQLMPPMALQQPITPQFKPRPLITLPKSKKNDF